MINIDIVPIEKYRGIDRMLNTRCFNVRGKKYNIMLEEYFKYIGYVEKCLDSVEIFYNILPFYNMLVDNNANVEMIIFDEKPIEKFADQEIFLLGMDISNQFRESITIDFKEVCSPFLNENQLFESEKDCEMIINSVKDHTSDDDVWKLYYVYKIKC